MPTVGYLLLLTGPQNSHLVMSACKKKNIKSVLKNPNEILAGKIKVTAQRILLSPTKYPKSLAYGNVLQDYRHNSTDWTESLRHKRKQNLSQLSALPSPILQSQISFLDQLLPTRIKGISHMLHWFLLQSHINYVPSLYYLYLVILSSASTTMNSTVL